MFGIGNTIGAGVFALTGVAAQYAGPSVFLSFLVAGAVALMTALMYSELASRIPINGSAFAYTYVTFGELPAFLVGWNLNLRYGVSAAGLSRGLASYFNGLLARFGIGLPAALNNLTVFGIENCSVEAVAFLTVLTLIYSNGMQESNIFNLIFTTLKLATLALIIILGYSHFNMDNFYPFTLEDKGGVQGTFLGASIIFYGYLGFDFITILSEDAKKPLRDVPLSVRDSTVLCIILYLLTATSLSGMARLETFSPDTAMAEAFASVGAGWASTVIYFCAFFGIVAAVFTNLLVSRSNPVHHFRLEPTQTSSGTS